MALGLFSKFKTALALLAGGLLAGGCAAEKSSNPTSPSVAGPIPGVAITAPKPVTPTGGARIAMDQQPVTLTVENASTNGERTLNYTFEIAIDSAFSNPVYTRESVMAGDSSTSVRLADRLAADHTYYWRSRAQDGANTGPYSDPATFTVVTPVFIGEPTLLTPAPNAIASSVRPRLTFGNAPRTGPVGAITYVAELSTSDSFASKLVVVGPEQPTQTSIDVTQDLPGNTYFFWHVRASDPNTIGAWSVTLGFMTPAVTQSPGPTPTPGPGGPVPPDMLDLGQAHVLNSPSDVASWPATSKLMHLDLLPSGAHVESTRQDAWPDVRPPGWDGPLLYTLWIVLKINGQLYTSGCIQYWRGLWENGGPVSQYGQNWYYDPVRWGPMARYQPYPGEQVGFFITAGDGRNNGVSLVKERSNVVVVPFPSNGGTRFTF